MPALPRPSVPSVEMDPEKCRCCRFTIPCLTTRYGLVPPVMPMALLFQATVELGSLGPPEVVGYSHTFEPKVVAGTVGTDPLSGGRYWDFSYGSEEHQAGPGPHNPAFGWMGPTCEEAGTRWRIYEQGTFGCDMGDLEVSWRQYECGTGNGSSFLVSHSAIQTGTYDPDSWDPFSMTIVRGNTAGGSFARVTTVVTEVPP